MIDAAEAATSFCTSVDAAFCADFDLYPYIMNLGSQAAGDAGLDTVVFVSPPASVRLDAPTGKNGAFAAKSGTGAGDHAHIELDFRVETTGLTEPDDVFEISVGASGTTINFHYVMTSSSAQLDVSTFADGGAGAKTSYPASLPPIGAWTHVAFDALCVQNGSVTLAFDKALAVAQTLDLSLPSASTSLSLQIRANAYNSFNPLNTGVTLHADNVVGTLSP